MLAHWKRIVLHRSITKPAQQLVNIPKRSCSTLSSNKVQEQWLSEQHIAGHRYNSVRPNQTHILFVCSQHFRREEETAQSYLQAAPAMLEWINELAWCSTDKIFIKRPSSEIVISLKSILIPESALLMDRGHRGRLAGQSSSPSSKVYFTGHFLLISRRYKTSWGILSLTSIHGVNRPTWFMWPHMHTRLDIYAHCGPRCSDGKRGRPHGTTCHDCAWLLRVCATTLLNWQLFYKNGKQVQKAQLAWKAMF